VAPTTGEAWSEEPGWPRTVLWVGYATGWGMVVFRSFVVGHLELFGLRQVTRRVRNRAIPTSVFRQPSIYRVIRHPLMVGFLIAFWSTPDMSAGRLLFAIAATGYILIAVPFEDHDLRHELGEPYECYTQRVPRFVPGLPVRSHESR
jgi:protein-S-isoprenylcysteine O-methyltransferase Ste14